MPAYNEQGCIASVVTRWLNELRQLSGGLGRLVVVNDGSKDKTPQILDELAASNPDLIVVHQQNGGHGRALRTAYDKAVALDAEWVFHVDSDDQFVCADLEALWARRGESHFLLGYRANRHDAFHRLIITRILRALTLIFFGSYLKDSNVPFRLIRGAYLKLLLNVVPATVFAPNIFLSVLAARDRQKLMFLPVQHKERETGKVSIVRWRLIKACLRCVRELFEFRVTLRASLQKIRDGRAQLGLA
ncbi:MAG: glycosyltransferase family 2 protein [Oligoflexia bacterium]|nr:glycosyltransferase family 2 protein [Oligoflexia bacterium]